MIFNYFQTSYLINLKERTDRLQTTTRQLEGVGIKDFNLVEAIRATTASPFKTIHAKGCALSHLKTWSAARTQNLDNFIVFEDDVVFYTDFLDKIEPIIQDLKTVDWDIFYFFAPKKGRNDLTGNRGEIISSSSSGLVKTTGTILLHAYAVNTKCLDVLLEKLTPEYLEEHNHLDIRVIDKALPNLDLNFYACNIDLAYQNKSLLYKI